MYEYSSIYLLISSTLVAEMSNPPIVSSWQFGWRVLGVIVCGVSNVLDNSEDEHGDLTNIDVPLAHEADDDSMDNELPVDDDSDPEDNIPLADL